MELRKYQTDCIEALSQDIRDGLRRVCLQLPTGAGKSLVIAEICRRALSKGSRILILAHQSELLSQNEAELLNLLPDAPTGIYCAKLGRKEFDKQIVFASRDSLGRKPLQGGQFNLILIDEAHLVNFSELKDDSTGNYAKILNAQDPNVVIIGLTATPFRKKDYIYNRAKISDKFFQKLSYKITMKELTEQGYLVPVTFPSNDLTVIDADNVKVDSTGDYNIKELESISMTQSTVNKCLEQWKIHAHGRKLSLFFCCSRNHAQIVLESLKRMNLNCGYIDGETSQTEREVTIERAKRGELDILVNVNVLTVGINIQLIDCIVLLRATKSASLFVQMVGRGARLHENKSDFVVLDMAGNFDRFGSLDSPNIRASAKQERPKSDDEGARTAPEKSCPNCEETTHCAATKCPHCGHIFFNHNTSVFSIRSLSVAWKRVMMIKIMNHETAKGEKNWIKVQFDVFDQAGPKKYFLFASPYASESRSIYKRLIEISPSRPSLFGYKLPIEILIEEGQGAKNFIKDFRVIEKAVYGTSSYQSA